MAKAFTATWLGDGDPSSQLIEEAGLRFIKGEPVKVPGDHSFNGQPWAEAIRNNPMFAIADDGEDDTPVDAGEDDERKAVMAELDTYGVKYRANASLETLRGLLK